MQPGPATVAATPNDRATRLAAVLAAWNVVAHAYPYFDVVHTDWPGALRTALMTAATDSTPEAFLWTLGRMMAALRDGHANAFAEVPIFHAAYLPVALDWVEGALVVTNVGDGAPAGLTPGDVVLAIDGVAADSALALQETRMSGATPQWRRIRAIRGLLYAPRGTRTTWRVRPPSGATRNVTLTFDAPRLLLERMIDKVAEPRPGIFYVDLGRITNEDFAAALPRLEHARGIVFDMRGYPSGVFTPNVLAHLTSEPMKSDHFAAPIIGRPFFTDVTYGADGAWDIAPIAPRLTSNVAFLAGGGTISYAESTMGIVEFYHLGAIVGTQTAGTNGDINRFDVPGRIGIIFTGLLVTKRNGGPHHGVGITPTVPVQRTIDGVARGADEVLDRALAVVERRAPAPSR